MVHQHHPTIMQPVHYCTYTGSPIINKLEDLVPPFRQDIMDVEACVSLWGVLEFHTKDEITEFTLWKNYFGMNTGLD